MTEAFGDFHQLPLRDGKVGNARFHVYRQVEVLHQFTGAAVQRFAVDDAVVRRFAGGEDVFRHGQVVAQAEFLKDHGDTARCRLPWIGGAVWCAVQQHRAAVGLMHTG